MENSTAVQASTVREFGQTVVSYISALNQTMAQLSLRTWALVDLLIQRGVIAPDELESAFDAKGIAMMVDLESSPEYLTARAKLLQIVGAANAREA